MVGTNPFLIMLIGLPGTGKSTWIKKNLMATNYVNMVVASSDDIIELVGNQYGLTYNEMFNSDVYSSVEKIMKHIVAHSISLKRNIVWDQTNLTKNTRAKKLALFGSEYRKIAYEFCIPFDHEKRLASRHGKAIPQHVLENMKKSFEPATLDEGFDELYLI